MPEKFQDNNYPNKIQIRAKLLSAIVNLQNNSQNGEIVSNELSALQIIADKSAVLDILHKEFLKENSQLRDYTITFLMRELIEQENIEKALFEDLANSKINDTLKAKIVGFLRESGKHVNYEQYITYFENPDEIIDADTVKLLENAKINPEAQIDFLDFLSALPQPEKEMLVSSLTEDYDGDNLTNILIPIILSNPYSEISQIAIKAIGESKSNLAYPVLEWLNENIEDLKVKANVQKSWSLLKLSGIKSDITKDYYKRLLALSPVYNCFINIPDGHGNVGLIFSRRNEVGLIQMFALVLNDIDGIIDCFGFNEISDAEFDRIAAKFYQNNKVVVTDSIFTKYLMESSEKISRLKYEEVPYEYIAWKSIMNDIDFEEIDMRKNLETIKLNSFLLNQVYEQGYFDKWFFEKDDNDVFRKMIDHMTSKKISDVSEFEKIIADNKNLIFDSNVLSLLNNRLLLSAYLARIDEQQVVSQIIFSLIEQSEFKDEFLTDYIKKSLYQYFLAQKDKYHSLKNATSIFARKLNKELNDIDLKYVEQCIKEIEKCWV